MRGENRGLGVVVDQLCALSAVYPRMKSALVSLDRRDECSGYVLVRLDFFVVWRLVRSGNESKVAGGDV